MNYLSLNSLKVYQLSRNLSQLVWKIFIDLSWEEKKIIGFQFVESTDSVGANIAEGYGRYHFLDRRKFYFNARGSLLESRHWFELVKERNLLKQNNLEQKYLTIYEELRLVLNGFIKSIILKSL